MLSAKNKLILVIAATLLVVLMAFIVTQGYVDKEADGSYDYEFRYAESFTTYNDAVIFPYEGRTFVIVDVVVKNDSYAPGIDTSPTVCAWSLNLDRMTYGVNVAYTTMHPNYYSGLIIEEGKTWGYTVVFEVPNESVGKKDLKVTFNYVALSDKPKFVYDPDLVLREFDGATVVS